MASFENCEIFSTYYFSYVVSYKATLKGGNKYIIIVIDWLEFDEKFEHLWRLSFDRSYHLIYYDLPILPVEGSQFLFSSHF